MPSYLRAHDYPYLIERWRAVARKAGIPLRRLVRADGYDLYSLITPGMSAAREAGASKTSAFPRLELGNEGEWGSRRSASLRS